MSASKSRRAGICLAAVFIAGAILPARASAEPRLFVRGSFESIVAAHGGTRFAVSFWSRNCVPCFGEMVTWRKIIEERADVRLVMISTDGGEDPAEIDELLESHGLAAAESWIFADPFVEKLRHEVDPAWRGELPRSYLFGAEGRARGLTGAVTETDIARWLGPARDSGKGPPR